MTPVEWIFTGILAGVIGLAAISRRALKRAGL